MMSGDKAVDTRTLTGTSPWALAFLLPLVLLMSLAPSTAAQAGGSRTGRSQPARAAAKTARTPFPATGYFSIAHKGKRSYFVTPTGQPFYSTGIDHVSSDPDTDQTTGQCPYCQTIASEYPSTSAWATATVSRLRSWGFNSLGPFTDNSTFSTQMPYSIQLGMASGDDWFASSFVTNADEVAATQVAPLADDPNLIGWYTDSELHWGVDGTRDQPLLDDYLALPAGSPGLAVAQQYVGNPNGFLFALATRYFQVTTAAIHMYDTHHLILGVKAEGQYIQPQLLEAASPYVDVFSIDDYTLQPGFAQIIDKLWPQYLPVTTTMSNFEQYVKRPIMLAEYSFIASGPNTPDTVPGTLAVYPTQQARAAAYTDTMAPLYEDAPWVVGDEWFEYVDEPAGGRFDGENNNFGVVNVDDQPYQDLVTQLEIMHSIASDRAFQSGPSCDSWANGPTGVTCTAYLPQANYPLDIFSSTLPAAMRGTKYSNYVITIGGRPDYTFSLAAGQSLPGGLKLNAKTGLLSGNPSVYGTFTFTVDAADSTSPTRQTATQAVTITIRPLPITVKNTSLASAVEGKPYCRVLTAKGGALPLTWTVSAGALPSGLSLGTDGTFQGAATTTGSYNFTVKVTDSFVPADSATKAFTLSVSPATRSAPPAGCSTG
jgi:hypothetical protein